MAYDSPIGISVQEFRIAEVTCFMGHLEQGKVSGRCFDRKSCLTPSSSFNNLYCSESLIL